MFTPKKRQDPVRLEKVEPTPHHVVILQRILPIVMMVLIVLVLILFVKICFAIVPPTDSGLWYNHALNGGR